MPAESIPPLYFERGYFLTPAAGSQKAYVIAAGTVLFLLPVAIFTFLLRNHLLRGMSFGAIRK